MAFVSRRMASPFGDLLLVAPAAAHAPLHRVYFADAVPLPAPPTAQGPSVLDTAAAQLAEFFAGHRRTFALPWATAGTAFQQQVWSALQQIPPATTRAYSDLARDLNRPHAARAVGAATGKNPLAVIVPCHRLIGRQGALVGYAGGLDRKQALLAWERAVFS